MTAPQRLLDEGGTCGCLAAGWLPAPESVNNRVIYLRTDLLHIYWWVWVLGITQAGTLHVLERLRCIECLCWISSVRILENSRELGGNGAACPVETMHGALHTCIIILVYPVPWSVYKMTSHC